ncbi:hypothetical protein D3C80_527320 [compost metagenome]
MPGAGEQRFAAVGFKQFFATDPLLSTFSFTGQDQRLTVIAPTPQYRAAAFLEQQQYRQVELGDCCQFPAQYACLQTGAGSGPWQQVEAQALLGQGQAGTQAGAADGATM